MLSPAFRNRTGDSVAETTISHQLPGACHHATFFTKTEFSGHGATSSPQGGPQVPSGVISVCVWGVCVCVGAGAEGLKLRESEAVRQTGMRRDCRFWVRFRKLTLKPGKENTWENETSLTFECAAETWLQARTQHCHEYGYAGGRPHTRTQNEPQMDGWQHVCISAGMRVLA